MNKILIVGTGNSHATGRMMAALDHQGAGQMSFGDIREQVCDAVCAKEGQGFNCCIVDIFSDSVIYESCGTDCAEKCYQRSYSILDGVVTLGDPTEVERKVEYIPVKAVGKIMAAKAGDASGYKWAVRIAAYGPDLNGNYWDKTILTAALAQFEGAKVFALKEAQHQAKPHRFGKSVQDLVGVLSNCTAAADAIYGDLTILPAAGWLRDNLVGCADLGLSNVLGLSVDVTGKMGSKMEAGRKMPMMTSINKVTVDVVYDPVAKGEFLNMTAAKEAHTQEETPMIKLLLAGLAKRNQPEADRLQAALDNKTITDDQAVEQVFAAMEVKTTDTLQAAAPSAELQEMRLIACGMNLTSTLTASRLPEPVQDKLRASFSGVVFKEESLQAAIKAEKEMLDRLTASGAVQGAGDVRINIGRDSTDKLQAAFGGMLGVTIPATMKDVPVFTSLRAAYVEMTGDTDVIGMLNPAQQRRMQAAYGDTTFAYALGNTLYRRMVQDYRELGDYGVSRIVGPNIRNARDFRTLESLRIGYYGDLPDVNTDVSDYPDLGEISDERVGYALNEKGGIITINRRMIINDDINVVQKIITRLPRAARRTLAKRVWNLFINNATYGGDNQAIFHAAHNNLGSAAYSVAAAEAAKTALFKQTEPNSGELLGLRPVTIAYPSDLRALVTNINTFNPQAVAVENGNSMYGYFDPAGMLQCPFMTDTNDWMMFADPNEVDIVELAFLNGQQEPQMLVADNPAVGQMFVGGKIQYRINHDYEAAPVDFRGVYKAVVA